MLYKKEIHILTDGKEERAMDNKIWGSVDDWIQQTDGKIHIIPITDDAKLTDDHESARYTHSHLD